MSTKPRLPYEWETCQELIKQRLEKKNLDKKLNESRRKLKSLLSEQRACSCQKRPWRSAREACSSECLDLRSEIEQQKDEVAILEKQEAHKRQSLREIEKAYRPYEIEYDNWRWAKGYKTSRW